MAITVRKYEAQVKDPATGNMIPAGLLSSDSLTAINTATTTAVNTIQAKGTEVIASIPSDYTALDSEVDELKSAFEDQSEWIGYAPNVFDARLFETTNSTNWTLTKTKDSITIVHNNTFSTGSPRTAFLNLPIGTYIFKADYSGSANEFGLYDANGYVKMLSDGTEFEVTEENQYQILFYSTVQATYIITDISIRKSEQGGQIQHINGRIEQIDETVNTLEADVQILENGFNDISDEKISEIEGTETENKAIIANGTIADAGSTNYRILTYNVTENKKYLISGSANYGNLEWCFYDNNNNVVETGTQTPSSATFTTFTDVEVTAPTGATILVVSYNVKSTAGKCKTQTGFELKKKWTGKKWVCVGDSLTAENIRTTKHYFDYVEDETGISPVNMGYSGSGYARLSEENHAFYQRIGDCPTDADVVTIFGSFNDLGVGLSIGTVDDTGTTTLAGCINTTIDNLQTVIPLVNLGIVAPTPWDTTQPATSGQAFNYVEMLKAICEHRSIPFLDLWRRSNLRPWDSDFRAIAYSKDGGSGTHPDENGHKLIAPHFEAFLDSLLLH